MYKEAPFLKTPKDENIPIWRYMDFPKFVSLLDRQELFFVETDKLGDPFEGSYTEINRTSTVAEIEKSDLPDTAKEQLISSLGEWLKKFRKYVFINSWHENDRESAALWKIYTIGGQGIAIKSKFCFLRDCFMPDTPDIYIGEVKYIDYSRDAIDVRNYFYPFFHKWKSYEHEKELRALFVNWQSIVKNEDVLGNGKGIPVNLDTLIDKVYVAPDCQEWVYDLVKSVMKRYNLDKEIIRSPLYGEPYFI